MRSPHPQLQTLKRSPVQGNLPISACPPVERVTVGNIVNLELPQPKVVSGYNVRQSPQMIIQPEDRPVDDPRCRAVAVCNHRHLQL